MKTASKYPCYSRHRTRNPLSLLREQDLRSYIASYVFANYLSTYLSTTHSSIVQLH
jgi:hypothetical protein